MFICVNLQVADNITVIQQLSYDPCRYARPPLLTTMGLFAAHNAMYISTTSVCAGAIATYYLNEAALAGKASMLNSSDK